MTRYVIMGAGAVGGVIGGRLHAAGRDVMLIARGDHLSALRTGGLHLSTPVGDETHVVPVAGTPAEAALQEEDVLVLAVKSQQTEAAVQELAAVAPAGMTLVCAQNGVANESVALRRFPHVYGMCVMLPAEYISPGTVVQQSAPVPGLLDVGRYPRGKDDSAEAIAADLEAAGFRSEADGAIMRRKYRKLLLNLHNALEAVCGPSGRGSTLATRARDEGMACFTAAGIDVQTEAEERAGRRGAITIPPSWTRGGSSSWQSLARGTGSIEADWLNGEIVLLGRTYGIPTPVNEMLQSLANRAAREGWAPGSLSLDEVLKHALELLP